MGNTPVEWSPSTTYLRFHYINDARLATLYATFYASSAKHPPGLHADVIIPISTLANDTGDVISVPPTFSVRTLALHLCTALYLRFAQLNVTVPQNAVGIYAEIIPSGNGNEEFWVCSIYSPFSSIHYLAGQ